MRPIQAQVICLRLVIFSKLSETAAVKLGSSNPSSAQSLHKEHKEKFASSEIQVLSNKKSLRLQRNQ